MAEQIEVGFYDKKSKLGHVGAIYANEGRVCDIDSEEGVDTSCYFEGLGD